jgi:hypothetical protein
VRSRQPALSDLPSSGRRRPVKTGHRLDAEHLGQRPTDVRRSLAHQSLNKQNQLHGAADMLEAELGETIIAKRKQLSNGAPVHLSDSRVSTLVPALLPDPIFGYSSTD